MLLELLLRFWSPWVLRFDTEHGSSPMDIVIEIQPYINENKQ
jgi:hypothetical protein